MENEQATAATETTETTNKTAETVDYKALYEKAKAEAEKQKGLKDQYASENAEYKRKAQEQMSDEERKEAEKQSLIADRDKAVAELAELRLERELLAKGFTPEEAENLKSVKLPIEAVKVFSDILKARIEENTKSVTAGAIKQSTPEQPMGKGTGATENKSNFQKYQESKAKANKEVKL